MRMQYDLILGLGRACSCSQSLRAAKLQLLSFPFDWITWGFERELPYRTELLCNGFNDWLRKEDLEFVRNVNERARYVDRRTKTLFFHDFDANGNFDEEFPKVAEKYNRRIARLYHLIESSRRILLVRVDRPSTAQATSIEDCQEARRKISQRFPNAQFDFCLMSFEKGRTLENRKVETVEEGFTHITLDYHNYAFDIDQPNPNLDVSAAALKALFSVRDYRTQEEIANQAKRHRQARLKKAGARNVLHYRWLKLKASILKPFASR